MNDKARFARWPSQNVSTMSTLQSVVDEILHARSLIPSQRSVLTAITGIDGSGKGYVTARIVDALQTKGVRAAAINIDGWLNLPNRRFDARNPAEHFYLHAIRFQEMFAQLILPLQDHRPLRIVADYAEEMRECPQTGIGVGWMLSCSFRRRSPSGTSLLRL